MHAADIPFADVLWALAIILLVIAAIPEDWL